MPCSPDHFIPILDEIRARTEAESSSTFHLPSSTNKHPGWGGRRPGAGAPKGNMNAFKHGRTSRRQAQILEAIAQVPGVQDALVAIAKRNHLRRKQAEEGMGVLLTRLLERTAAIVLSQDNQGDNQDQNNQGGLDRSRSEFLDYLNETSAQMREILGKRSRLRRVTIKPPGPQGGEG